MSEDRKQKSADAPFPPLDTSTVNDVVSSSSDVTLIVTEGGRVEFARSNMSGDRAKAVETWTGLDLRDGLTIESIPKFERALSSSDSAHWQRQAVELNHVSDKAGQFPVRYTFHRLGRSGPILMLGLDQTPIALTQQQLVKVQMELERDYEAHRDVDTRFRVLLEAIGDAVLFVSMATGRITDMNRRAAMLLGGEKSAIVGHAIAQEFDGRRRSELLETLANSAISEPPEPVEVRTRRSQQKVQLSAHLFRIEGERMLLCRIAPEGAANISGAPQLMRDLAALFEKGSDAVAFVETNGQIITVNEAFLALVDVAHQAMLRGRSMSDFFARGTVDMKVLLDNVERTGALPLYATKMIGSLGNEIPVELSATYLSDRNHPAIALVLRDAARAEAVWRPTGEGASGDVRSVMELVGSTTLKQIVADTTDMVEKMCIETAVELTQNNRVAAAEMLGLSRQSLYVKLRKYGLLSKDQ